MTQDVPSSRVASTDNGTVAESSPNIRRRLGNWTTTPAAGGALAPQGSANATVPLAQGANANDTVELMTGSSQRSNDMMTVELQQAVPLHATAPMQVPHTQPFEAMNPAIKARLDQQAARSVSYHTAELHEEAAATAPFVSTTAPFAGETAPFPGGVTAPIPVDGTQTAAFTTPLAQPAETVPLPSQVDSTVALGASPDATVQLPGQQTVPIGTATVGLVNSPGYTSIMGSPDNADLAESGATVSLEIVEEIRGLRAALETNPDDPDLTMELALALNEAGERTEAHQILLRLHDLLQAAGDHEGANRIRTLLGDAVTAPIAADANPTQPMPRQTTDALKPRTGTLSLRAVPASRDGRIAKRQGNDYRERPAFAARDIPFFDPLPQIERVSGEAQRFFNAAEEDRERKRFRSALDNLQMATALDPTVPALFLRLAEVQLKLGFRRRALDTIHALDTFESLFRSGIPDWVFSRLRLHAEPFDLTKVQHLVDTMIESGNAAIAAPYAARLIEHLSELNRLQEALEYADRVCGLAPGETNSTLEAAILAVRMDDRGRAIERWEFALRNGADPMVGKIAMAALIGDRNEGDHWRLLCDVMPAYRADRSGMLADAYRRMAQAAGNTPLHKGTIALFTSAKPGASERNLLAAAAGDRSGTPIGRAAAAAMLARILQSGERGDEYLAAVRTTLNLFTNEQVPEDFNWEALLGFLPTVDEMSHELGVELMKAGDMLGAVEVLKQGYALNKANSKLTQTLAEAFARTNQLGSALTILDELAMSHRKAGRLDEMAAVLRQMSQLAPANIKVKSRLVDAYLQRGFVAEARAELIQRADLEERAGMTKEAIVSLQRAADLSWNLGFPQESFNLYDRILALDPEDVANRSALVNLYLQVGRLSDAAEHQRAVVDLALTHGRKHEAIAALHQVIGLTPDDMTAYYQLGEALSSMGEYQQAEKVYRRIVLMNPDDAVAQAKATAMAALKEQMAGA